MIERRLGLALHHGLHGEGPAVGGGGAGLGPDPGLLRVTPGHAQLVGRVDRGVDELRELVIVDVGLRRLGKRLSVLTVSKVNTTDEAENRLSKLDASFN